MARSLLLAAVLLLTADASAQTFRPAGGPWTRAHALVGSTPDGRIFARVGPRLGVTRDGGATWAVVSETSAPTRLAGDGAAIYGAFPDGVRLSRDGGATWTPFGLDGQNVLDLTAGTEVYAVTPTAVYVLGDLAVWQPTPAAPGATAAARLSRIDAAGGTIAVGAMVPQCSGNGAVAALYRSRDGGASWATSAGSGAISDVAVAPDGTAYFATRDSETCLNQITPGRLFAQAPPDDRASLRQVGDFGGLALSATGQPILTAQYLNPALRIDGLVATGGYVMVGTRPSGGCNPDPPCSFVPSSGLYASGSVSGDVPQSVGFVPSRVRALALTLEAGDLLVPSDGAVFTTWGGRRVFWQPLGEVRAFVRQPAEFGIGLLALSAGAQGPPAASSGPFIATFGINPPGPTELSYYATVSATSLGNRLVTASKRFFELSGVFVVTDSGNVLPRLQYADLGSVEAVSASTVYAGAIDNLWSGGGGTPPPARIFRSDDRGDSWTPDDAGLTARDVYAFAETSGQHLAGTSGGVFARTPGAAWQADGLAGRTVYTFARIPESFGAGGLVAGTDDGLFRRDAAGTWSRYGDGLEGRTVYAVLPETDALGAWIGVGTDAGLFQTRAFGVASEAPAPEAPAALSVLTAPNPGRGLRTVRLAGLSGRVSVAVFDGLGRRVADLGTDATSERSWDASRLPAGVYVVRATTEAGATATARAVVVR